MHTGGGWRVEVYRVAQEQHTKVESAHKALEHEAAIAARQQIGARKKKKECEDKEVAAKKEKAKRAETLRNAKQG